MSLSQIGRRQRSCWKSKNKKNYYQPKWKEVLLPFLGMWYIVEFNSIINQPNSAILSVGAIVEKPVVKNGQIVVGNTMMLSLACDHRTVDGATGALFLQTLKQYIENR
jgi:pyruvate dehydrogenase E2 component (dihydrolipoamide acetyltransferase)